MSIEVAELSETAETTAEAASALEGAFAAVASCNELGIKKTAPNQNQKKEKSDVEQTEASAQKALKKICDFEKSIEDYLSRSNHIRHAASLREDQGL